MSKTIDEKVVEMRFDNKNFEENIQTSISSLDKLKQSLKLEDASKGLQQVEEQAKKVDVSGIGTAIDTVKLKFSAFEIMAITALSNITNSAINTGKQLVKSLSVDNIAAGWDKFSKKTVSVGTLVAQGYDQDTVTKQLERLNWFTDETSYNFTDMVNSIAKFTASGQDLEQSVTALEGIATWAALSGQNATTASHAMYQLSQAMGAGVMRKEDYKSIQNVSMDTDEFRQKALDAGVALGTLKKNADGTYKSLVATGKEITNFTKGQFAEHLTQDKWFTSDVMMKVFNDYSAAIGDIYNYVEENGGTASEAIEKLGDSVDQFGLKAFKAAQEARTWADVIDSVKDAVSTGWMTTFEMIFGNYEEAKSLFTDLANELYDIFAEGGNERNRLLKEWKSKGGRDDFITALWNVIHGIESIIQPVKDAFRDIFPRKTADELVSITKKIKDFTDKLILGDETSDKLRKTFKGLFSAIDIVKTIFSKLIGAFKPVIQLFKPAKDGILNITSSFGDWLTKLSESIKTSEKVEKVFSKLKDVIQLVVDFLRKFVSSAKDSFGDGGFSGILKVVFDKLGDIFGLITDIISKLTGKDLSKFKDNVISGIHTIRDNIVEFVEKVEKKLGIQNGIFDTIKEKAQSFLDKIKEIFSNFRSVDTSGIDDLSGKTEKAFKPIVSIFEAVKKIITTVWEIVKKLAPVVGTIVSKLADAIGNLFESIGNAIKDGNFDKILDIAGSGVLIALGISIEKFIISAKKAFDGIGSFKSSFLSVLDGVKQVLNSIKDTLVAYQKDIKAKTLLKIAAAIALLTFSVLVLTSIDTDVMISAIGAISILFLELTAAMKIISKLKNGISLSSSSFLIGFALALLLVVSAVKKISELSSNALIKGLGGVTTIIILLIAVAKTLSKNEKQIIKGSASLVLFATAIRLLIKPVQKLGEMPFKDLLQGMVSLTILIGLMIGTAVLMKKFSGSFTRSGASLIIFAESLRLLIKPVQKLGEMPFKDLLQGMVSLTILIGLMIGTAVLMKKFSGSFLAAAISLVVFSEAINILVEPVRKLGEIPFKDLLQGMVSLTILIGLMVGSAVLLNNYGGSFIKASVGILLFAASFAVLTPVIKTLGSMKIGDIVKALVAMAGVFIVLGVAGYALAPVVGVVSSLSTALLKIGVAAILAGAGIILLASGLLLLSEATKAAIDAIVDVIIALVVAIPDILKALAISLKDSVVSIIDMVVVLGKAILDALRQLVPDIVETALVLVAEVLASLAAHIPEIVESLLDIVAGAIIGLANGLPKVVYAISELITALITSIASALSNVDFGQMVIVLLEGMAFLTLLITFLGLATVATVLAVAVTTMLPLIAKNLSKFINEAQPFIDEISKVDPAVLNGAKNLAEMIMILTKASILEALTGWFTGSDSLTRFGQQLADFAPYITKYYKEIKDVDGGVVSASANAAKALAELATNLPNQGGVISWFAGDNKLSDFADQLSVFGPKLKDYSDSIKGLDPDLVINSANAALALSELATKLPNQGGVLSGLIGDNKLSDFANGLADFGPKFKEYADSVSGLTNEQIETTKQSASAALALAQMAGEIPNSGGVVSWFAGDNSLVDFAKGLKEFAGPYSEYITKMSDFTAEDIDKTAMSAEAAIKLANAAGEIPNTGGVAQWFAGEGSLKDFADGLNDFVGPFSTYIAAIKDLKPEELDIAQQAANVALTMAQAAGDIPNEGGVVSWFTGDNSLSNFAAGLNKFIPEFKNFVNSAAFIKAESYERAKMAAEIALTLAQMAGQVPNSGGVASWFAGDNSLIDFAAGLNAFAPDFKLFVIAMSNLTEESLNRSKKAVEQAMSMANLAASLEANDVDSDSFEALGDGIEYLAPKFKTFVTDTFYINTSKVSGVVSSINEIIDMAKGMKDVDPSAVKGFSDSLESIAKSSIDKFIKAFSDAYDKVRNSVGHFIIVAKEAVESKKKNFINEMSSMVSESASLFEKSKSVFYLLGRNLVTSFINGVKSRDSDVKSAFTSVANTAIGQIKNENVYEALYNAGIYSADGLVNGMKDSIPKVQQQSAQMAHAAQKAAELALKINSPSKVFYGIGEYSGEGLVNGLSDYIQKVYWAGDEMGDSAAAGLEDGISKALDMIMSDDFDNTLTIKPVLDLSDFQNEKNKFNRMVSGFNGYSVGVAMATAGSISGIYADRNIEIVEPERSGSNESVNTFTQINHYVNPHSSYELYKSEKNLEKAIEKISKRG